METMEPKGFLRLPEILKLIPISKSMLSELIKKGEFPKQIKLGTKTAVWKTEDVYSYINRMSVQNVEAEAENE